MRTVIQRVENAHVAIDGTIRGSIGAGYVVFLGIGRNDTEAEIERLWSKIFKLRIFADGDKPTGATLTDIGGNVLIISQFTLYADCRKGNRPSFGLAGEPEESERLYQAFVERARADLPNVQTGEFGADMQVSLVNDGPFTICLDTDDLARPR